MRFSRLKATFLMVTAMVIVAISSAFIPVEVKRLKSPDGQYEAIGYRRLFWQFVPLAPGQGSNVPTDVEIISLNGQSMGKVKVPMGSMMDEILWTKRGASIRAAAEWDFEKGTAYYWSEDGNKKIGVKMGKD